MAQLPLPQTIRRLETELGVELFTRTTRHVALTDTERILGTCTRWSAACCVDRQVVIGDNGLPHHGVHPAKKTSSSVSAFISTWSPDGMVLQSAPASGGAEMPRVSRARALTVERRPGEGDRPGAVDREGVAEPASQGVAERAP